MVLQHKCQYKYINHIYSRIPGIINYVADVCGSCELVDDAVVNAGDLVGEVLELEGAPRLVLILNLHKPEQLGVNLTTLNINDQDGFHSNNSKTHLQRKSWSTVFESQLF